jgi:hypothetical protein
VRASFLILAPHKAEIFLLADLKTARAEIEPVKTLRSNMPLVARPAPWDYWFPLHMDSPRQKSSQHHEKKLEVTPGFGSPFLPLNIDNLLVNMIIYLPE